MAISQNIIHMMNGEITVDSTLGKGSRFTVSVALKFRDAEDGEPPVLTDLPVLVVDDERDVCEYASLLLKEVGMRAFWVLSGQEAVAEIVRAHEERDDYFAVILDWKMPDMDGLDTAREIRRRVGPDLPIIIGCGGGFPRRGRGRLHHEAAFQIQHGAPVAKFCGGSGMWTCLGCAQARRSTLGRIACLARGRQ